jgi:hypothetical protein
VGVFSGGYFLPLFFAFFSHFFAFFRFFFAPYLAPRVNVLNVLLAMKMMKKGEMFKKNQIAHIKAEREVRLKCTLTIKVHFND